MRVRSWRSVPVLVLLVVCASCDLSKIIENIGTGSQLGAIVPDPPNIFPTKPGNVVVPDTATRGVAFTVTVQTHGNKCLKAMDRTDVVYAAPDTVIIRPYDLVFAGQCGDAGITMNHTASVKFNNPGTAVVRAEGVSGQSNSAPVTVTRTVVVR